MGSSAGEAAMLAVSATKGKRTNDLMISDGSDASYIRVGTILREADALTRINGLKILVAFEKLLLPWVKLFAVQISILLSKVPGSEFCANGHL